MLDIEEEGNELLGDHGDMAGHNRWLAAWLHARNQGAHGRLAEALVHYDHCSPRATSLRHNDLQAAALQHSTVVGSGEVALDRGMLVVRHKEAAVDIEKEGMVEWRSWNDNYRRAWGPGHVHEEGDHALGPIEAEEGKQEDARHRREEDCDEKGMAGAGYRIRNETGASRGSLRAHRYNGRRVHGRDALLDPDRFGGKTELGDRSLQDRQKKLEVVEAEDRNRSPT